MSEDLKHFAERVTATWEAGGDAEAFVNLFADEVVWNDWTLPTPIRDKDAARAAFRTWADAFPDLRTTSVHSITQGDEVAAMLEWTATNTGSMKTPSGEIPATNRTVTGRGSFFLRVEGGKIIEMTSQPDVAGLMAQLGLAPGA